MYVGWSMKTDLVTIGPDTSIFKARDIMDSQKISHLPITDERGALLGIVTDRDLRQAWASPATTLSVHELTYVLQKLNVSNIMTKEVITAAPDMTIERAARIMHDNKIGALPVVKKNRLAGIITTVDLMEVLLNALGMSDDSKRLFLLIRDRIGVLAELGRLMQQAGINIRSIMTLPLHNHPDIWQLMLRVNVGAYDNAARIITEAGYRVIEEYVDDLAPYIPKET